MPLEAKRELLRHAVTTIAFRGGVAIRDMPDDIAGSRVSAQTRSPVEILAHIGDLLVGSRFLLEGKYVEFSSQPLPWADEVERFYAAVKDLDSFLTSETPLAHSPEKMIQGPIGDALTHIGQIVILRRIAGHPIKQESYFTADIMSGQF
jgi:hypothetical protein